MGNIISFLKENGEIPFADKEWGAVDALILSQLAYFNFDGIVSGVAEAKPPVSMEEIRLRADFQNLFSVKWYKEELREFFECMVAARRYHNMKVNYYENKIDEERQTQFCAVTFFLGDGSTAVAFRGTDDALSGWKEDFNMAYMTPVPSQEMSRSYMEKVGALLKRRKGALYLMGHSKGGNLAVYAAVHCDKKMQEKIQTVYNFDGPGFRPEFWARMNHEAIRGKIRKLIPQSSFVGMIMQQDKEYEVTANNATGMLQHLPLTWRVEGDDFVYLTQVEEHRMLLNEEINEWILSLSQDELIAFLEAVYYLIDCTKASTLTELGENWMENLIRIGNCYMKNRFEEKNREIFWESAGLLLKMLVEDGAEKIRRSGMLQSAREKIEDKDSTITGAESEFP